MTDLEPIEKLYAEAKAEGENSELWDLFWVQLSTHLPEFFRALRAGRRLREGVGKMNAQDQDENVKEVEVWRGNIGMNAANTIWRSKRDALLKRYDEEVG